MVGVKDYRYVFFPHNVTVPEEYVQVQQAGFTDPAAPRLIRGWGRGRSSRTALADDFCGKLRRSIAAQSPR